MCTVRNGKGPVQEHKKSDRNILQKKISQEFLKASLNLRKHEKVLKGHKLRQEEAEFNTHFGLTCKVHLLSRSYRNKPTRKTLMIYNLHSRMNLSYS